jgi:hypothetical protein
MSCLANVLYNFVYVYNDCYMMGHRKASDGRELKRNSKMESVISNFNTNAEKSLSSTSTQTTV